MKFPLFLKIIFLIIAIGVGTKGQAQNGALFGIAGDTISVKIKRFNWLDPFRVKVVYGEENKEFSPDDILGFKDEKGRIYASKYIYDYELGLVRPFVVLLVKKSPWGNLYGKYEPKPWSADESGNWIYFLETKGDEPLRSIDAFNYVDILPEVNPEWTELVEYGSVSFDDIPELFQNGKHYSRKYNLPTSTWIGRFELPMFINTSIVQLPNEISSVIPEFGGIGYDFGAGWLWRNQKKKFDISFGMHFWQLNFSPQFQFKSIDNNGKERDLIAVQKGAFNNIGTYFKVTKEFKNTLMGLGFDYALSSAYQGETKVYEGLEPGLELKTFSSSSPFIGEPRNGFADLLVLIGGKYRTQSGINIKPFFQLNIPLKPIITQGKILIPDEFELNFNGVVKVFSTRFGLVFEFGPS